MVDEEWDEHEGHVDADAADGGADESGERGASEESPGCAAARPFDVGEENGGDKDVEDELKREKAERGGMGVSVEGERGRR